MKNLVPCVHDDTYLLASYNEKCFTPNCRGNKDTHFDLISPAKFMSIIQ